MAKNISTILNLVNNWSAPMRKIQESTQSFSKIVEQATNYTKGLDKEGTKAVKNYERQIAHTHNEMKKFGSGVTGIFKNMTSSMLGFGLGLAGGLNIKSMVASAQAGQKAMAQMNSVLTSTKGAAGLTSKQLTDLAMAQSKVTTFSKGTTIGAESLLLTFTKIGKTTFPDTIRAAQNMSVAMGTNLNSSVMMLGKALNSPADGLSKLTRSGVTFTEQQQKQIKAMQAAGNVAGAQKLMLQELNKEFGGSAAAQAKTWTGQIAIMKNTLTGLGGSIASTVMPYATKFIQWLGTEVPKGVGVIQQFIPAVTKTISDVFKKSSPIIGAIVKDMGSIIKQLIPSFNTSTQSIGKTISVLITGGLTKFKNILDYLKDHIGLVKAALAVLAIGFATFKIASVINSITSVVKAFNSARQAIGLLRTGMLTAQKVLMLNPGNLPLLGIIAGIAIVAGAVYLIYKNWKPLKQFFIGIWAGIKAPFVSFSGWIKNWGSQIKSFFGNIWNGIKSVFNITVNAIISFVVTKFEWLINDVSKVFNGFKNIFSGVWKVIKLVTLGPVLLICDLITGNFTALKNDATKIFTGLKNALGQIWNGIKSVGIAVFDIFKGSLQTIWYQISSIGIKAWNVLKNGVINIGRNIASGAKNIFIGIVNWFKTLPARLYSSGVSTFTAFKTGAWNVLISIPALVKKGFQGAISFIKSLPHNMALWAHDMIDGFVKGIEDKVDAVKKGAQHIAEKIRSILHFSKPDEGPLTNYETYMPDFVNGMTTGMTSTTPNIWKSTTNMTAGMSNRVKSYVSTCKPMGISIVSQLASGISDSGAESNILSVVKKLTTKVIDAFKNGFGIHSPSRVFFKLGDYIVQGFVNGLNNKDMGGFIKNWVGDMTSMAGGAVGGNVSGWLTAALGIAGAPMSWLPALEMLTSRESGNPGTLGTGNPSLVNSIGVGNEHATGLLQLLPSTYQDMMGTNVGITNPIQNAVAGIKHIMSAWKSIYNIPGLMTGVGYQGYINGTDNARSGINALSEDGRPELVVGKQFRRFKGGEKVYNANQTSALLGGSGSGDLKVEVNIQGNVIGNDEYAESLGDYIYKKIVDARRKL